jgi:hypothetical protein
MGSERNGCSTSTMGRGLVRFTMGFSALWVGRFTMRKWHGVRAGKGSQANGSGPM